jgi:hypothetical protein
MKKCLPALLIAYAVFAGCTKSKKAGSVFTHQLTGTRSYDHTYSTNYPVDSSSHDTVQLTIQYIDDATIRINSQPLTFTPGQSTDSIPCYQINVTSMAIVYSLQYYVNTNKVVYNCLGGSATVHFNETYTSY